MTETQTEGALPGEVVTHARVRLVDLPLGAGSMALITLDNDRDHTRPSTFGPAGLASLDAALDQVIATPGIVAVGVTGKPFIFAVGADLSGISHVRVREQAIEIAQLGHNVFRRFGELDVPTFAFVNGAAIGGGFELPLHCTYRTVSSGAAALSLPEVFLGLVPGWGGAWLLPNLIGPADAMQVILTNAMTMNRQLKPAEGRKLGIFDAMFEPADFLEQSLTWAARVLTGEIVITRKDPDRGLWDTVIGFARSTLDARTHGAFKSPYAALDLIAAAKTSTRDEGFAAEDESLTDLVMGDELRASLYAFDLVQKRAKSPVGAPDRSLARPVTLVGVVGAGLMASQLALLFAKRLQVPVIMTDLDQDRIDKGLAFVREELEQQVAKGRMKPDMANRLGALISASTSKDGFADASFVIEAVFENMAVKQQVFAELEAIVSDTCVIASNTSSLSLSEMSSAMSHPERVVGFHFFNPVAVMPLLEIIPSASTDDATLATAFAVGRTLKKSTVLVQDTPGFVVNRLLNLVMAEVFRAVDEGTDLAVADRALRPLGMPMSPFTLMQLVGPAVAFHVMEVLHDAFPERYPLSDNLRRIVEAGKPGIFLPGGKGNPKLDPEVVALLEQGDTALDEGQVLERVADALAREARIMLDDGVVTEPQDLDLCMILGAGMPFALGGLTPYLDRSGASIRATGKRFLAPGIASLPE
jgi:3-hydroxyacyl-CoA dehydrogenase/1,4-dihydroxy-2-naphthoyl-CoA synthase